MIMGAEADALGNAGITTFKPGADTNGLLWWGEHHAASESFAESHRFHRPHIIFVVTRSTRSGPKGADLLRPRRRFRSHFQTWQQFWRSSDSPFSQSRKRIYCLALGLRQTDVSVTHYRITFQH